MARTKKKPEPSPPPAESLRQKNIFALRGTEEFKRWLDRFSKKMGMPTTVLVEHALKELAERRGFEEAPSRVP